jgi:hypothetical protein
MVAHLFSRSPAPLLQSKLKLGIPHVELAIPSSALVGRTVLFCRYNIARHRVRVFTTSPRNGRMIGPYRVPVAATVQDQAAMLSCGVNNFEVLVADSLPLPDSVVVRTYSDRDASDVARLLRSADRKWAVQSGPRLPYPEVVGRIKETQSFIESAHANGSARHNVLEFDR